MPDFDLRLEGFYRNFRQQLFTYALAITRSAAQAEDAVHDAFCRMLREKRRPDDLKAYVFRAVRNAALNQFRGQAARTAPLPETIFDPGASPAQSAEDVEFARRANEALERLSADERETIVQHIYAQLTFQQIALVREAPLGTVTSWYRRGLRKLHTQLESTDGKP